MKLAEMLLLRADAKKKVMSLRERIARNVIVQENERPHEDPAELMKEAGGVLEELEHLALSVGEANSINKVPDGRTLAQVIARRERLVQQHAVLQLAVASTKKEPDRYSMKEIKWVAVIDVAKLQKQSDDLSQQIRQLNALIQETNWKIEVA